MTTFQDIFKSSFLERLDSVSLLDTALALVLAFLLGLFIFLVYKRSYSGVMYSPSFGVTLIALTLITTLLILAVTSNIVLSLGMVGALSIVRFRTAIKDPVATVFMFWSITCGIMAGAGLVALIQIIFLMRGKKDDAHDERAAAEKAHAAKHGVEMPEHKDEQIGRTIGIGSIGFALISVLIAFGSGMYHHMSAGWLIAFMFYAAFAAFVHEMIVGLAAMHSGWFPAFAVALITLLVGILIGFPPEALAMLCGFAAATGPAFADMGYDLKAGWILRGNGKNPAFELDGRRQQFLAASMAFLIAIPVVAFVYQDFFSQGLVPPVAKVYIAAIQAGVSLDIAKSLLIWAIPGALIQFIGGPSRQMGVLLATGLLINNPMAGWAVLIGLVIRIAVLKIKGPDARGPLEVLAAGLIAGDALLSFFSSIIPGLRHK